MGGRPEIEVVNAEEAEQAELRPPDRSPELHRRLAVRSGLPMRPVAGRYPESRDPVNVEAAPRTVEDEVLELPIEVGLHVQQREPEHLGMGDERIGPAVADVDRLVDEGVGLRCLLCTTRTARSRMSRSCRAIRGMFTAAGVTPSHGESRRPSSSGWPPL